MTKLPLTWLSVGKVKNSRMRGLIEDQVKNLKKYARIQWTELPAVKASNPEEWQKARSKEAERIRKAWPSNAFRVVLDETGKEFDSREFAEVLGSNLQQGRPMAFVVGNHWGLEEGLRKEADLVWRLSRLTFAHEHCILCGLEQVFRGLSIVHKAKYHRDLPGG